MNNIPGQISSPLYMSFILILILIISILSFVVGVGLAMRNPAMLRYYNQMHRRFSLRRLTKPLFMPHFIEPVLHKHLNLLGAAIIMAASTTIFMLMDIDADVFRPVFLGFFANETSEILAGYTKSFLLVGNVICVVLGLLALFLPGVLSKIETYADKWYTLRKQTRSLHRIFPEVGNWVLAHPTVSGITLSLLSLLVGVSIYARL